MRGYKLSKQAIIDLNELSEQYSNIEERFLKLVLEVCEKGYDLPQTGKPEPLRGKNSNGQWSKRLTIRDRMVYKIEHEINEDGEDEEIVNVYSCRFHYTS